ncbi:MAG: hypothetical protein H0T45_03400 [Pyrinomonadaceae bacterium]|nr:hypothetical protein [Pyrinomonadaceae bacterium]
MNTTERLYYADSHLMEFDARVVHLTETPDGRSAVVLDRTAFYPSGGGQPTDTGTLNDARVVECVDLETEGVLHVVEDASLSDGQQVRGRVDWSRRLDHLQQHTGQHILSQAFVSLFAAPTRGFRMLEAVSEIDLELGGPSATRIEQAVDFANRIIWENRPLRIHHVTAAEAARMPLRKDSAREGELRVVEIDNFDLSPCGGTHAQRTGEVGLVAVRSWERAKGMTRVEFVAGGRALADYRRVNQIAREVASQFSAARDDSPELVRRLLAENKQLSRRLRALAEIAARVEADELLTTAQPLGGFRLISRVLEDRDADALKQLALALIAHPSVVALLGSRGTGDGTARLVFARAADAPGDMNVFLREACQTLGGRGGGRPDLAQGGGPRIDNLDAALDDAARRMADTTGDGS